MGDVIFQNNKVLFAGGKVAMGPNCCCEVVVECVDCEDGIAPQQFQVVISGITNNSCEDCDDLNGTYILDHIGGCIWIYDFSMVCNTFSRLRLWIYKDGANNYHVLVKFDFTSDPTQIVWNKDYGVNAPDCDNLAGEVIPLVADSVICDASAATCLITSL